MSRYQYYVYLLELFDGQLSMNDLKDMEVAELDALVQAKTEALEKRTRAEIEARKLEKQMKSGRL